MIDVTPVILCGGSGTRLWPLSRRGFPKQFLCLAGDKSLFQEAALRLAGLSSPGMNVALPLVVTGEEHRFLAIEQLREIGIEPNQILLEPAGRNTAPALTFAALSALHNDDDPVLVAVPADQTIADVKAFTFAIHTAVERAAEGLIAILGMTPDRPETGYGYIQATRPSIGHRSLVVERFVEKPDLVTARAYLAAGDYHWNGGMFVVQASTWLRALGLFRPEILKAVQTAWVARSTDKHFVRPGKDEFAAIPSESIDYAVMENCPGSSIDLEMVPLDAGWNDLGAWDAVWKALPKDTHGNAHRGDVVTHDCRNTLVHANSRLVSVVGLDDVVVVETPDAVMVTSRSRSQDVKHVVSALDDTRREESALHRKVHRPWGWYDSIDEHCRFKVKRIMVKPGEGLSLQMHKHRAEHWVVVSGIAEVTKGDQVFRLAENQSTFIAQGQVHRLSNPGAVPLEIIEVQSGEYLGEDDIVRLDDRYGRLTGLDSSKADV